MEAIVSSSAHSTAAHSMCVGEEPALEEEEAEKDDKQYNTEKLFEFEPESSWVWHDRHRRCQPGKPYVIISKQVVADKPLQLPGDPAGRV